MNSVMKVLVQLDGARVEDIDRIKAGVDEWLESPTSKALVTNIPKGMIQVFSGDGMGGAYSVEQKMNDCEVRLTAGTLAELRELYFAFNGRAMKGDEAAIPEPVEVVGES